MRFLSLGVGAIGGYFGGRLVEGGADVTFLVREPRKHHLAEQGLVIESPFGNFSSPVQALTQGEIDSHFDVVLLTCKAYDLRSAIDTIRPAVGPGSVILPLLNGLAHMDALNDAFGRERVLGGLAKIAVTTTPGGVVKHLNDWRFVSFGEQAGGLSARVGAIKKAFDRTSVLATAETNITQLMWEKLVHLATVAGMTAMMRASVGEIARSPGGADLMTRFFETNASIATRAGFPPSERFLGEFRKLFSDRSSSYTASMLRDIERGGPIEADHIVGFMLEKARAHGVDDSLHNVVYVNLKAYEERRKARGSQ